MRCTCCDAGVEPSVAPAARFVLCDPTALAALSLVCSGCALVYCGHCADATAVELADAPDVRVPVCPACGGLLDVYEP